MHVTARHFASGDRVRIEVEGDRIASIRRIDEGPAGPGEEHWVAPAFWDIQLNGRWGYSFSGEDLTIDRVIEVVLAQRPLGTARLCPTLITAGAEALRHGVATIAAVCEREPEVARMVVGIHLEGPFLSERDGYRGAHPAAAIRDPSWPLIERLQAESGGRVALITLAPERPGAIAFIERATAAGIVVALGHTAADGETMRRAVEAGATLSTHLGNGIAAELPRHPNPIWHQAAEDRLMASVIADGHHLDAGTLRVLARAKGPDRLILVSDASPLAGLPAGRYGDWAVDPSGKIVVAGTPYLAGSNQPLEIGIRNLLGATSWSLEQAIAAVTSNPARLLGQAPPELKEGQPADLVLVRPGPGGFSLLGSCIGGAWFPGADHVTAGNGRRCADPVRPSGHGVGGPA
ncbi:MAG: amidohydrolase family protein [Isosphaeraceae bacterium]